MRKIFATKKIFAILAFLAATAFAVAPSQGALSVQNGVVVGSNGQPPQLRGMSLFWDIYSAEGGVFYNDANTTVAALKSNWKANVVRAAIGGGSTQNAIKVIDAAIAQGIYVIVDWHSHCAQNETDRVKSFFTTIAQTYGNSPNVIFEIYNEPIYANCSNGDYYSWASIKSWAEGVISEIRKYSNNLLIVGTPQWSARVDAVVADPITTYSNIAYTFHFYATTHGIGYRGYVNTALCAGIPVFITEWGTSAADGNGSIDWSAVATWVDFIESRKLSWVNWSVSTKNETSSIQVSGPDGLYNTSGYSASGNYMYGLISALNTGNSHKDVTNSNPLACSGGDIPPQEGGGAVLGTDTRMEAENYNTLSGNASKEADETAIGDKMYLAVAAGVEANYQLVAPKDTILMLQIVAKSSEGAKISVFDGIHTTEAEIPVSSDWAITKVPVALHPNGFIALKVLEGSAQLDYYAWRAFYYGDSLATPPIYGDLAQFPDVLTWDKTDRPISALQASSSVLPATGKATVYTLQGKRVSGEGKLSPGVYLVKQHNSTKKVVVR
jgi:endoglucanase